MGDNEKGQKLMDIFRRIIGVVLIVIGAVVAAHMILEPLYHVSREASPNSPIWNIIDPFTALAVLLGVIFSYIRKSVNLTVPFRRLTSSTFTHL